MIEITHTMLDDLRTAVSATMSPKRFRHTAAVEEMTGGIFIRLRSMASSLMRLRSLRGTKSISFACMNANSSRRQIALRS